MNMSIITRESDDVTIVDLRGRLVAGAEGADLLRITKLHTFFEIMDDEALAVKSFSHANEVAR